MTSETDEQFLDSMEQWVIGSLVFKKEHRDRLFALARRGAAVEDLGQVGQLSEELERLRAALALFACDCTVSERCVVPDACRNFAARRILGYGHD